SPFFLTPSPTTAIYTLSLHDALPICDGGNQACAHGVAQIYAQEQCKDRRDDDASAQSGERSEQAGQQRGGRHDGSKFSNRHCALDRKSTRLNSSHLVISYAVFCLKKK